MKRDGGRERKIDRERKGGGGDEGERERERKRMGRGNDGGIWPKVEVAMLSDVETMRATVWVRVREVETGWRGGASLVESGKASPKRPPTVHCGLASRVSHTTPLGNSVSCRSVARSNYPRIYTLDSFHHVNKAPGVRVCNRRGDQVNDRDVST